jgi:putative ABC transport system permease protein
MTSSDRIFAALLRMYPRRTRERFGVAMRHAFACDLQLAQARGLRPLAVFWVTTFIDTIRFATADRMGGLTMRESLTIDWRDAWRALRAAPVVTLFAVLSLALGIGSVTSLFTILNSLTLKTLPVREPGRLVLLADYSWTNPIWEAIRDRQHEFADGAFAWATERFNLSGTAAAEMVEGLWVSGQMFGVLGVAPVLGRPLTPADDLRGGGKDGPVAVISHRLWQRRYGGALDIIGRTLLVERVPFTIVGVAPPRFFGPDVGRTFDVAIPLATEPLVRGDASSLDRRTSYWLNIMFRLGAGQTAEQATAAIRSLQPWIREVTAPEGRTPEQRARYLADPLTLRPAAEGRSPLRSRYAQPLTVILGIVGVVLLIACGNIANLLIARASIRRRDLTLRLALGASRWRLARQLLAESLLIAASGALIGVLFARWASRALVSRLTTFANAVHLDLTIDWRVLGFVCAVSTIAAVLFGVAPALAVRRIAPIDALKDHGRTGSLDPRLALRHASVIVQAALSLTLVVAAGLFMRTLAALDSRAAKFGGGSVLLVQASVDRNPVRDAARAQLFLRLQEAAATVPGVAAATVSYTTPVADRGWNTGIAVPADSPLTPQQRMSWVNAVSRGWFTTFGLRLSVGRDFDHRDTMNSQKVAIVNEAFTRRFLGGGPAVGTRFTTAGPSPGRAPNPTYEVIGVVEDAVYRSLRAPLEPTMYLPVAQWDNPSARAFIAVRAAAGPSEPLARSVAAAVHKEDPTAVLSFHSLDQQVAASLMRERLIATLAGFFAALALFLAAVGLYGVTAYTVVSRRAEIGIRIALGASTDGVVRLMLRRVAWLVGCGVLLGACLSAWASTFIRALLYGLEPRDPATFAGAAFLLMGVAAVAAWLPARRAARIDPMSVLRDW